MHSLEEVLRWFQPPRRGETLRANMWQMRTVIASDRFHRPPVGESGIETAFCIAAEFSPYVLDLITQPFTCQIPAGDRLLTYTPDALVQTAHGVCVVECKPFWKRGGLGWSAFCEQADDFSGLTGSASSL